MIDLHLKPFVCDYYLTYRCNASCEFCSIWNNKEFKNVGEASLDVVVKNLSDLRELGIVYVNFTGGEPLYRQDLENILAHAKALNFITSLTTNGIFYKERAKDLAGLVDYLSFSLDAPLATYHNSIRGIDCFDTVVESIKLAQKLGQRPIINFTVTRDTIGLLPEMVEFSQSLGVHLWVNPVYDHFGLQGFNRESLQYIKRFFKHPLVSFNLAVLEFIKNKGNKTLWGTRCRALNSKITISPDDYLLAPCFFNQRKKIRINSCLKMLYNSEEVKACKSIQGKDEICEGCMRWPHMVSSFNYRLDKYLFLNLASFWMFLQKRKDFSRIISIIKRRNSL